MSETGAQAGAATQISLLTCSAHVDMAINSMRIYQQLCDEAVQFVVHDDGSLTSEETTRIGEEASVGRVIARSEADERMQDELGQYSGLIALRKRYPLALKLFDAVHYCEQEMYCYMDCDVLFLKPFCNPFHTMPDDCDGIFMQDREHCYSMRSWQKLMTPGLSFPARVNTGLIFFRKTSYDLEYLNWFINHRYAETIPWVMEQTAWAALGARAGCRTYSPQQVRIMREGEGTDDLVAGHFTHRTRHLLPHYCEIAQAQDPGAEHVSIDTVPGGTCSWLDLAAFEARRVAGRLIRKQV